MRSVPGTLLEPMRAAFRLAFDRMPDARSITFTVKPERTPGEMQGGRFFVTEFEARDVARGYVNSRAVREAFFHACTATGFGDRLATALGVGPYVVRPEQVEGVELPATEPATVQVGEGTTEEIRDRAVALLRDGTLATVERVNYRTGAVEGTRVGRARAAARAG